MQFNLTVSQIDYQLELTIRNELCFTGITAVKWDLVLGQLKISRLAHDDCVYTTLVPRNRMNLRHVAGSMPQSPEGGISLPVALATGLWYL